MCGYIPRDQLKEGVWYKCEARNFRVAKWNGKEFEGLRNKFGQRFIDTELYWDDDPHYGTVKPYEETEDPFEDCPKCGKHTVRAKGFDEGGGVECYRRDCDYWFCY